MLDYLTFQEISSTFASGVMTASTPLPRLAVARVRRATAVHPVVFVVGARQVGKSTLVQSSGIAEGRTRLDLDDPVDRARVHADPLAVLERGGPLVIDEFQREPSIVLALKRAVDRMGTARRPGMYIVTGSANPHRLRAAEDSLAGRAAYVHLHGLTRGEAMGESRAGAWAHLLAHDPSEWSACLRGEPEDWRTLARAGSYPTMRLHALSAEARHDWCAGYVRNHVDRDIRDISAISDDLGYHRLMRFAAARSGGLLNQAELGRDAGTSAVQVSRWLGLLEATFLLTRLPAYARNAGTRLIKAPKLYWRDVALSMHMGGRTEPTGADLETVILGDLSAWVDAEHPDASLAFWRTSNNVEVDFVLDVPGRPLLGVEVKASRRLGRRDHDGLRTFVEAYADRRARGVLLYGGDAVRVLSANVVAVPWWMVL